MFDNVVPGYELSDDDSSDNEVTQPLQCGGACDQVQTHGQAASVSPFLLLAVCVEEIAEVQSPR